MFLYETILFKPALGFVLSISRRFALTVIVADRPGAMSPNAGSNPTQHPSLGTENESALPIDSVDPLLIPKALLFPSAPVPSWPAASSALLVWSPASPSAPAPAPPPPPVVEFISKMSSPMRS